jgi:hypothetical protein
MGFLAHIGGNVKAKLSGCLKTIICCVALQTSSLDGFPYTPRTSVIARLASDHF